MAVDASDVVVFKRIRFRVSTLVRYVCVFICIHFQQRFQIDAFSVNTLSVFERISVDGRPKRIEMYAFSNENALVWTGSYSQKVVPTRLISFARNKLMTASSYIATYYKQPLLKTESDDNLFHNWEQLNKQCKHILITWPQPAKRRCVTTCAFVRAQSLFSTRRICTPEVKRKFSGKKVVILQTIYGEFSLGELYNSEPC